MKLILLFILSFTTMAFAQETTWQDLPLTNAQTGATFTFADFAGQTVYVEPMATWCANCRQQLGNVNEAKMQLGDEVTFVALSVETTLKADQLASYAKDQGFDFTFAVMTPEVLRALAAEFGQAVTSPIYPPLRDQSRWNDQRVAYRL